ncbi:hypothetical protein L1987_81393 [Smallanthus sonchifolius]|uniref:Uncharacterized protein n=1 Tax=Smallanthus sonchifolius TaxID=185202 RepID=A0ACB8YQA3_9ASTR|nr:hypothetical protein L1987_81393 [Smallanthus sonchifolius]
MVYSISGLIEQENICMHALCKCNSVHGYMKSYQWFGVLYSPTTLAYHHGLQPIYIRLFFFIIFYPLPSF